MRKIVAVVVLLLAVPTGTVAQGFAGTARINGPLLAAALAEAARLEGSFSNVASTQSPPLADTWDQLQALPVGTRVRVTLMTGAEIEGRLVQATPDAVVLSDNRLLKGQISTVGGTSLREQRTFLRADVVRVQARTERNGVNKWLVGGLVAAGVIVYLVATTEACSPWSLIPSC